MDPSAFSEDNFSGDVDNYRGVDPRAVDKEAHSILYRYMGDLFNTAMRLILSGSRHTGQAPSWGGGIRL